MTFRGLLSFIAYLAFVGLGFWFGVTLGVPWVVCILGFVILFCLGLGVAMEKPNPHTDDSP